MNTTHHYQICLLGCSYDSDKIIQELIKDYFVQLGISLNNLIFYDENSINECNRKYPLSAIFFGYKGVSDSQHPIVKTLLDDSVFILPVVDDLSQFSEFIPRSLHAINGCESSDHDRIVSTILENFRLLRPERRLFISYKRNESQSIAIQLYEKFEASGFDVFLDTHSVAKGADFQNSLWHRLADSDIMVLLDTPGFRSSRWTKEELARANATNIQILHLQWPGVKEDQESAFSVFLALNSNSFVDPMSQLDKFAEFTSTVTDEVIKKVENLRARALAARHRYLVDNLLKQAKELSLPATIQPDRFISLKIDNNKYIAVVPAVGIPTAERYEIFENRVKNSKGMNRFEKIWLIYDERGILQSWINHLEWLNNHLPLVSFKVSDAKSKIDQEIKND